MTADQVSAAARALVERSAAEQGIPITVTDPAALARVAAVLARNDNAPPKKGAASTDTLTAAKRSGESGA